LEDGKRKMLDKLQIITQAERDEYFMRIALEEARYALQQNNFPIGAVIVRNDEIIARGHNQIFTKVSNLAHAEMESMLSVYNFLFQHKGECEIYTTLEPCMMCCGAILFAHIKRVTYAAKDATCGGVGLAPHLPFSKMRALDITGGVLAYESRVMLVEFIERTGYSTHLLEEDG
jgi:tRNA(adenine34) deaminase